MLAFIPPTVLSPLLGLLIFIVGHGLLSTLLSLRLNAEGVAAGDGVATRKHDATCCMWRDGKLWKRHELKAGKPAPAFKHALSSISMKSV